MTDNIQQIPSPLTVGIAPVIWTRLTKNNFTVETGVSNAQDKSGNGNDGVQSGMAEQPAVASINGRDVLSFDGIDDDLDFTYVYGSEATWFLVAEKASSPEYMMSGDAPAGSPFLISGFDPGGGIEDFEFEVADTDPSGYRFSLKTSATAGLHILGASHKDGGGAGGVKGYFDGAEVQSIDPTTTTLSGSTLIRLGSAFFTAFYSHRIAEFILFDRILSIPSLNRVNRYLANEWAITI